MKTPEEKIHTGAAAGSVIKKVIAINPDLSAQEIIDLIRKSIRTQGGQSNEFSQAEIIDEAIALDLARATLAPN